ncbi:MAG TPA: HAMP domain-containing sensor histidine kinase [Candidatus Babeliales bacterium]|nr:HAMP domain-containing sensor histidine kinase [Candidatus Babeliales bacterium]
MLMVKMTKHKSQAEQKQRTTAAVNKQSTARPVRSKPLDLVATTVHELKSPLTVISGLASMLEAGQFGQLTSEQSRYVGKIDSVSQRLLNLVESLLSVNRAQTMDTRLQPISITSVISEVLAELTPRSQQQQMQIVWKRRKVVPVLVDRQYLYQIIYNLIDNAIKYSPANTKVTIKFRHQGGMLYLRVSDQGVGVKPNDLKYLYKRFGKRGQPVSGLAGSSGLGLYIVKQLAEAHGGQLRARTLPKGTCFIVRLPLAQQLNLFPRR